MATRVACANQMRRIVTATVNYAPNYKDSLPVPQSDWRTWNMSGEANRVSWLEIDLHTNPPTVPRAGTGLLVYSKYLSTSKILVCPALSEDLKPVIRSAQATVSILIQASETTLRSISLRRLRKRHGAVLTDFYYDIGTVQHADSKRRILQMNFGYADGSVKQVDSAQIYQRLRSAGTGGWGKFLDVIGAGEYLAANKGLPYSPYTSASNPANTGANSGPSNYFLYKNPAL